MAYDAFLTAMIDHGCKEMEKTTERFMQDEEFYYDILLQTLADPAFEQLGEDLKGTDAHKAFDTAHTLKGIVANCGITPVYDEIVKIVEPLRAGNIDGLAGFYDEMMTRRAEFNELLKTVHP